MNKANIWENIGDSLGPNGGKVLDLVTSQPTSGRWEKGALAIDVSAGVIYRNEGTLSSCSFVALGT